MKLSVLDQSQLSQGQAGAEAIQNTIKTAQTIDEIGYYRLWLSEHHNMPILQGSTPEVLLSSIGAKTKNIRIGSGGIMLPNHSAYHVAENFRMLEALYPNRIDLGIGRASGGDSYARSLLNSSDRMTDVDFDQQVNSLDLYLHDECKRAIAMPMIPTVPPIWLLSGAGHPGSGALAAQKGLGLAVALFINPDATPLAVKEYKKRFIPSAEFPKPKIIIAMSCVCSDNPEKLTELKKLSDYFRLMRDTGNYPKFVPSPDYIKNFVFSPEATAYLEQISTRQVYGTPQQIKQQIESKATYFEADEAMISMMTYDVEDRLNGYKLIAKAFGLT